jgi:prophage regulatory protein
MTQIILLRILAVMAKSGLARSTHYKLIDAGLWVRPIRLSARAVAWPSNEVDAILAARIAGKSDDEIRSLVQKLEAARKDVDNSIAMLRTARNR